MTARVSCYWAWAAALLLPGILGGADKAGLRKIDSEKSVMTVHVLKSGVFSAFGHEHQISAPIQRGKFSESDSSVELTLDYRVPRSKRVQFLPGICFHRAHREHDADRPCCAGAAIGGRCLN